VLATGTVVAVDGFVLVRALVGWPATFVALSAAALGAAAAFCVGLAWPVSPTALAAALDRAGALEGRIAAGLAFRQLPAHELRGFASAAVRDAERRASLALGSGLVTQAVPVRCPRSWPLAVLLTLGVGLLVARRPVHPSQRVAVGSAPQTAASVPILDTRELETRSEAARSLSARVPEDERLRAQLAEYEALLASLAGGTIAQEAALQRVLALEAALARQSRLHGPADREATTSALRALADELRRALPALARALDEADAARAATALHGLSESLSRTPPAEREQLRRALDQARAREKERAADEARERELTVLQSRDAESREPTVLARREKRQRELDKLRRRAAARPKRTLEKLSRELGRAGTAMADEDRDEAADALDEAGSALDQLDGESRDAAQARDLARELSQLRESLQRRALSEPDQARDERTRREAAGQRPSEQGQRQAGPSPGAPAGEAPQRDRANRQSGSDTRAADTETLTLDGHDERRARRETFDQRARGEQGEATDAGTPLRLGPASGEAKATLLVPMASERSVIRRQVVDQSASSEHDERQLPSPTSGRARLEDRTLSGARGDGPTRSQVIRSAAQSGFASLPYHSVYGDYRAHAEAAIEADAIPAGYRFQVRRYFELVRPRQPQDPSP